MRHRFGTETEQARHLAEKLRAHHVRLPGWTVKNVALTKSLDGAERFLTARHVIRFRPGEATKRRICFVPHSTLVPASPAAPGRADESRAGNFFADAVLLDGTDHFFGNLF
jgi:hypothetical protein